MSNTEKLLRAFFLPFFQWLVGRNIDHSTGFIGLNMSGTNFEMLAVHAF